MLFGEDVAFGGVFRAAGTRCVGGTTGVGVPGCSMNLREQLGD